MYFTFLGEKQKLEKNGGRRQVGWGKYDIKLISWEIYTPGNIKMI